MPNTDLRTNLQNGDTGLLSDANTVHGEINRMSRDTGWRDLSGLLANGWVASDARIRRYDDRVTVQLTGLDSSGSTNATIFSFGANESTSVSSNFGPDISGGWRLPIFESSVGRVQFYGNNTSGLNAVFFEGTTLGTGFTLQITWNTYRAWPNFLPPAV